LKVELKIYIFREVVKPVVQNHK